jgi:hypothetical protein
MENANGFPALCALGRCTLSNTAAVAAEGPVQAESPAPVTLSLREVVSIGVGINLNIFGWGAACGAWGAFSLPAEGDGVTPTKT